MPEVGRQQLLAHDATVASPAFLWAARAIVVRCSNSTPKGQLIFSRLGSLLARYSPSRVQVANGRCSEGLFLGRAVVSGAAVRKGEVAVVNARPRGRRQGQGQHGDGCPCCVALHAHAHAHTHTHAYADPPTTALSSTMHMRRRR